MGREAQPPYSRLTPRLEASLQRINFYRFCQLLEKRHNDKPLLGSTSHPADDPVRFAPHPGMGFPASELKSVEYDADDDAQPPRIRTTFMGMYGVDSRCRPRISTTSPSAGKGTRRCRAFWIFSATVF